MPPIGRKSLSARVSRPYVICASLPLWKPVARSPGNAIYFLPPWNAGKAEVPGRSLSVLGGRLIPTCPAGSRRGKQFATRAGSHPCRRPAQLHPVSERRHCPYIGRKCKCIFRTMRPRKRIMPIGIPSFWENLAATGLFAREAFSENTQENVNSSKPLAAFQNPASDWLC